jgi:hypothetical protein
VCKPHLNILIFIILIYYILNGKLLYSYFRLKEQLLKDQDTLKYIPHAEDAIENHGIFKIKDVELVGTQEAKLEDMKDGLAKLEEEKVKELEE